MFASTSLISCKSNTNASRQHDFAFLQASGPVSKHSIFELSFKDQYRYLNPFFAVKLDAVFRLADGAKGIRLPGFYYGGGIWKIRFCPRTAGSWTYSWSFAAEDGFRKQGSGKFECTIRKADQGRILSDSVNKYRWVFEEGRPFFPLGLQDVFTSYTQGLTIDGERRRNTGRMVSLEEYFTIYGQAGFNLFRFSQRNASFAIFDDLENYRERESLLTDRILQAARRSNLRVMFGFFGYYNDWTGGDNFSKAINRLRPGFLVPKEAINNPEDTLIISKEQRFIRYCIARWGAYVDFWELLNERKASDDWTREMARYVNSIDPDQKPVTTSWPKPELPEITINAPHWYESESDFESDLAVHQKAQKWKSYGKPVIVGEQGNSGMNWDPTSAVRMRIRAWTALFDEIGLIFWNTSWSKSGMHLGRYSPGKASNIYLGSEERKYIRVLTDFTAQLGDRLKIVPATVSSGSVRVYALGSPEQAAAYLHHYGDHSSEARNVKIHLSLPQMPSLVAQWISPASGEIVARDPISAGETTLNVPSFRVDVACIVTSTKP